MIIDIHTHIFPDKVASNAIKKLSAASGLAPFSNGTLNALLDSMGKSNVDISCILPVATDENQVEHINNFAADLNEKYRGRIISFAGLHPNYTNYKHEIRRIKTLGFKGIKVHPLYQNTYIYDVRYLRMFAYAAELDIIILTHAGLDIGFPGISRCSPKMIRKVIREIGDFKFVLAHLGGWEEWEDVLAELADTNVYIDTAFSIGKKSPAKNPDEHISLMKDELAQKIIHAFSCDRVLFGSDSPWTDQKESIEAIKKLSFSKDGQRKILGDNAAGILGLDF